MLVTERFTTREQDRQAEMKLEKQNLAPKQTKATKLFKRTKQHV